MDPKEIKDYLHLYLGCECEFYIRLGDDGTYGICELVTVDVRVLHNVLAGLAKCTLKLRPLSDISEEDFKECALLYWGYQNRDIIYNQIGEVKQIVELKMASKYGTAKPYVVFDKQGKEIMRGTLSENELNPMQFQFLLSKGYDLFELIESGLAIDATKLKTLTHE